MVWVTRPIERRRFLRVLGGAAGAGLLQYGELQGLLSPSRALAAAQGVFPLDEALAGRVLSEALGKGAPFAELYLETRVVSRLQLAESTINSFEQGVSSGCGIRVVEGERTGYAFVDSFEEAPMRSAARDAAAIASGPQAVVQPRAAQPTAPPGTVRFRVSFDQVAADERVGWLRQGDEAARKFDPAIRQVTIEHVDEMLHFLVVNSDGLWCEDTLPLLYTRINAIAEKNGSRGTGLERISYRQGAEQMEDEAPAKAARNAARMALAMCGASAAPAGEMPVILCAGGGVLFHEAVGHGLEGDAARRGASFYSGKIGQTVASPLVSVLDSGAIPDLRGSYNIDDEGTPPLKNLLIEKGVLRGFLSDRITAQVLNSPRTGNGRRQSYRYPPLVRMSNTYLEAGRHPVEEMIADTRSGLYVRTLGGGEVDTSSGNFTFGVLEAYRIEDGKITSPVRGANLVGSGPEIMKRIDRVGPDLVYWPGTCGKGQWVPITAGAPTLRISSMTVGGSDQG